MVYDEVWGCFPHLSCFLDRGKVKIGCESNDLAEIKLPSGMMVANDVSSRCVIPT